MELLVPNETTIAAMEEQDLPSFDTIDDVMADLNADDRPIHAPADDTSAQTKQPHIERE